MREPGFWYGEGGLAAAALAPAAWVYGAIAVARMARPGARAGVPVVCVGNLTVGGAGKTPTAQAIASVLKAAGRRPAFLSRGYGGRLAGPVTVDPDRHRASDVGDEPLLLARAGVAVVARDRAAGARFIEARGADVVVMDDGFQNPALDKTLSIVAVDAGRGIGNGRVFPAGPLRAPLDAQLEHAHAVLAIGKGAAADGLIEAARATGIPVLRGRLAPDPAAVEALRDRPVLAFAGIGDPDKFFRTLADAGIAVRERRAFPDHHRYRRAEALDILRQAEKAGLVPVTTEKDHVRLSGEPDLDALAAVAKPFPVRMEPDDPAAFRNLVLAALR